MTASTNVRFADLKETLMALLATSQKFTGFLLAEELRERILEATEKFEAGKEGEAVRLGQESERWLRNAMLAFFINSPKFFASRLLDEEERLNLEPETVAQVSAVLTQYSTACEAADKLKKASQTVDLAKAADKYSYMIGMVNSIPAVDRKIKADKAAAREAAIKKLKEDDQANRLLKAQQARERRKAEVLDLRAMLAAS